MCLCRRMLTNEAIFFYFEMMTLIFWLTPITLKDDVICEQSQIMRLVLWEMRKGFDMYTHNIWGSRARFQKMIHHFHPFRVSFSMCTKTHLSEQFIFSSKTDVCHEVTSIFLSGFVSVAMCTPFPSFSVTM